MFEGYDIRLLFVSYAVHVCVYAWIRMIPDILRNIKS